MALPDCETHEIATVVPKSPTQAGAFEIFGVQPKTTRILLLLLYLAFSLLHWQKERISKKFSGNLFNSIFMSLFYYFGLTLSQAPVLISFKDVIWSFCVSFLIIEFLKDQLFMQLSTLRFVWPESLEEISIEKFDFVTTNPIQIKTTEIPVLKKIAKRTKTMQFDDVIGKLEALSNGKTVFFGRTHEIDWFQCLLHPDKFALLEERYLVSHHGFFVSTKWPYYKKFIKL